MNNLLNDLPARISNESFETLLECPAVRIERIVSHGHVSPSGFWYEQQQDEWVAVLRGRARLRFEDEQEPLELAPGDFVNIKAHRRHRVDWTAPDEPTIWLAIHYRG